MEDSKIHILYLDPEPNNLHAFSAWFRRKAGYECHTCSQVEEALALLERYPVQILLVDQPTPESTGMEFLVRVPFLPEPPVKIVLTAHRELAVLEKAINEETITAYFSKPIDFDELESWIRVVSDQLSVVSKKNEDATL